MEHLFRWIGIFIITIIMSIFLTSPKNKKRDDKNIIFEYGAGAKNTALFVCILCAGMSIVGIMVKQPVLIIFFAIFALIILLIWVYYMKTKISLKDNVFYVTNILGKKYQYKIEDIKKIQYKSLDGIVLYMSDDNKKINISAQMTNYKWLLKDLKEKNFEIVDTNNQKIDIGW